MHYLGNMSVSEINLLFTYHPITLFPYILKKETVNYNKGKAK